MVGQWMGKARKMAAEFQGQFQEAMREAEMADLKKSFDEVKEAASSFTSGNLMTSLQRDVDKALDIEGVEKPAETTVAAIEPPAAAPTPEPAVPEPLAITPEVEAVSVPQEIAPAASDEMKDAKAS
jgi:sec-independent protein translocase protein TatB